MLIQISSGQGPCECEIAVKGIFDSLAKEFAELNGNELLIDLYCGAGTIGLSMAENVKKNYWCGNTPASC